MININNIIENRIKIRENNRRKALLDNEIKRINNMNSEIVNKCNHDIIIYYGKDAETRFECFSCGVKSSRYEQENFSDEEYINDMRKDGKIVIEVSKYLNIIKKEALFRTIETVLGDMLNENRMDVGTILMEIDVKIKALSKN